MLWLAGGSLLILAALIFLLFNQSQPVTESTQRPLKVFCAAALKPAIQAIAADYERETGQVVEFEFGDSGTMLGSVSLRPDGDLFLPADDSFVRLAQEKGLVAQTIPLCQMRAVALTQAGNPSHLASFEDLLKTGLKVGIANPDTAAIGKVVRDHLIKLGKWRSLATRLTAQFSTVTDSANGVQLGSIDAAIVWDSVAARYPDLTVVRLQELDGAVGQVALAVLRSAEPVAAKRFANYIAASDKGISILRKFGFNDVEHGKPWVRSEP